MKTNTFLILVMVLIASTFGAPAYLKKEELEDLEGIVDLEIHDSIPVPPDLPTGPLLYHTVPPNPASISPQPSPSKIPSPSPSRTPAPSKTPTPSKTPSPSPTKNPILPNPDLPPVPPSKTPTPSPKPDGSLLKPDLTPSPTLTGEYRCLSSDTNDPRDWNLETIEAYCTKAMLKCQCVLSSTNTHSTARMDNEEYENEIAIKGKNDVGKLDYFEDIEVSAREEDNVLGFHEMCQLGWVQETVCDPETMRCAVELYGRFVFGNSDGALVGHGSWWTICKEKLRLEGEI